MKRKRWRIIIGFLLVSAAGISVSIYYYNKPHTDVKKSSAAYKLSARNLIWEYQEDETVTNKKYTENIIQVKGEISEIAKVKGYHVITLNGGDLESKIICQMLSGENIKIAELEKGQQINVKGICSGYLLDVMMIKCILMN